MTEDRTSNIERRTQNRRLGPLLPAKRVNTRGSSLRYDKLKRAKRAGRYNI